MMNRFKELPKELTNNILSYDDRFFIHNGNIYFKIQNKFNYTECLFFHFCCFLFCGFIFFIIFLLIFKFL